MTANGSRQTANVRAARCLPSAALRRCSGLSRAKSRDGCRLPWTCALLTLSLALFTASLFAQEQAPNRRDFKIVAKDHTFIPSRIEVAQDDLVKVTLTSEDRPTSFAVDAYRIAKRAAGGETITFEFRADQPGTFTFYCNLTTDAGCKNMKGTLVVTKR